MTDKDWTGAATPQAMSEVDAMRVRPDYWWPVLTLQKRGIFDGSRRLVGFEVRTLGQGLDELPTRLEPNTTFRLEYRVKGDTLERIVACAHLRTPSGVCVLCGSLEEPC